jgi:hypothetical protein
MSDDTELERVRRRPPDFGLFELPPVARNSDPTTSHRGARAIQRKRPTLMALMLDIYRAHPNGLTPAEACAIAGVTGGWKRVSDLKRTGQIVATGDIRDGGEVLTIPSEE